MAGNKTTIQQKKVLENLTQQSAAFMLGVSARSLRDWQAPRNEDGTYSAPVLVQWQLERELEKISDPLMVSAGKSENLERYRKARADREEFDLAAKKGEFYPKDQVDADWGALGRELRDITFDLERIDAEAGRLLQDRLDRFKLPSEEPEEAESAEEKAKEKKEIK